MVMLANLWKSTEQRTYNEARPVLEELIEMGTHTYNPYSP